MNNKDIQIILEKKPMNFQNFKTNYKLIKFFKYPIKILCNLGFLPPSLYPKFFT